MNTSSRKSLMSLGPTNVFLSLVLLFLHVCVCDGSKSVEYSQKTMEEALKKVEEMGADLGGTEILRSLEHIYSQPCILNHPRQVIYTHTVMFPSLQRTLR